MSPEPPADDHLADLRRRWEEDPGSRVFLQLADEYRRTGQHGAAVEVLEAGLARHPNHVSARVALGRTRLEQGDAAAAATALERALELDATNLVANKALIEAYLALGDSGRARERLDLYTVLNDVDPDLPDLRRQLDAPDDGSEETAAPSPAAPEPPFAPPEPGIAPPEPATAEPAVSPPRPEVAAPPASPPGPEGEPFGELGGAAARHRYLAALTAEGLFPVAPAVLAAAAAAAAPAPAEPEAAAPDFAAPEFAEPEVAEPAVAEAEFAEPEVAQPGAAEPEALAMEASGSGPEEAVPEDLQPPGAAAEDERPTVTLGRLYLDQGHPRQARGIFAAVLDREPGNEAARRGFEEATGAAAGAPPAALTAAELLRDADPDLPPRQALLHAYLARLRRRRGSAASDVR